MISSDKVAMGNPFWFRGLHEPTKIRPKLIPAVTRFIANLRSHQRRNGDKYDHTHGRICRWTEPGGDIPASTNRR